MLLLRKTLKKIFATTLTMLIILTVYTLPTTSNDVLRTNLEIKENSNYIDNIYLLDNNLLVKVNTYIEGKNIQEKIEKIITYLTIDNNKIPIGLNGYIPKNTKILDINIEDKILNINFSKELLETDIEQEKIITGITYSLLELDEIEKIKITVENNKIKNYENILDKKIGINNKYLFNTRNNINKVVIYYIDKIDNNMYYVPITKYLNDNREKIEIIIDELKKEFIENNLICLIDTKLKLLDYKEESNVLFLNFNNYLIDNDDNITEKNIDIISNSVFDNYDVNMVMFEVNNKKIKQVKRQ